jgi:hypothetical protein
LRVIAGMISFGVWASAWFAERSSPSRGRLLKPVKNSANTSDELHLQNCLREMFEPLIGKKMEC